MSLLYVEDDKQTHEQMEMLLNDEVKEFYQAYDGEEGLTVYKNKRPDIILTDINMPKLDGLEMSKIIKSMDTNQEIVIISAFHDRTTLMNAINLKIDGFVMKPISDIDILLDKLEKIASDIQNKREVQKLRERLEFAFQNTNYGLWDQDFITGQIYYGHNFMGILGYDGCSDLKSDEIERYMHPNDIKYFQNTLEFAKTNKNTSYEVEYRLKHHDDKYIWVRDRGTILYTDKNNIKRIIGTISDITKEKLDKEMLEQQAHNDSLTKIPNRFLFEERLNNAILSSQESGKSVALMYMDLDGFKSINDTWGHESGDEVLRKVALQISSIIRASDTVARIGGDEFAIIVTELNDTEFLSKFAQKIIDEISKPVIFKKNELIVSCSIGISTYPKDAKSRDQFIRNADKAMYKA